MSASVAVEVGVDYRDRNGFVHSKPISSMLPSVDGIVFAH